MRITKNTYLAVYSDDLNNNITELLLQNNKSQKSIDLDFRVKSSAVYSANIEGNSIDLNSYLNSELATEYFKPSHEIKEIEDLVSAYEFAISNKLDEENLLKADKLLSNTILIKDKRGVYRTERMGIYDNNGLVYLAVEPEKLRKELELFFKDIKQLLSEELSTTAVFYHASLIHLKFAQIHPFWDGNGRTARLLEKWFLAHKLGKQAWKIQSEQFYKNNIFAYYKNINLGMDYYSLNYNSCLPFLKMLIDSLKT